ncbi:hypothetical protein [Acinetobacter puyangensis]
MKEHPILTKIKGLGRKFAWNDVYKQQDAFMDDFKHIEISCDCYEGGAA